MAKCVVFGGTGFIGKHLVTRLLSEGHHVSVFTRADQNKSADIISHPMLQYYFGDFFNAHDVDEALSGKQYVFHLISLTNPAVSDEDPHIDIETNVRTSINLLEACVRHKIKKVIYTSSGGSIYGEGHNKLLSETDPTFPISPYAIGKQTIEGFLRYFHKKHQLDYLVYRISNVYGQGQNTANNKHGVISVFLNNILAEKPLTIYGDGTMTRDYIEVHDLTFFMAKNFTQSSTHELYNVGSGQGVTVSEILTTIEKVTKKKANTTHAPTPSSYVKDIVLDCSRATAEFGKIGVTSLEDGVRLMYEEYLIGEM